MLKRASRRALFFSGLSARALADHARRAARARHTSSQCDFQRNPSCSGTNRVTPACVATSIVLVRAHAFKHLCVSTRSQSKSSARKNMAVLVGKGLYADNATRICTSGKCGQRALRWAPPGAHGLSPLPVFLLPPKGRVINVVVRLEVA